MVRNWFWKILVFSLGALLIYAWWANPRPQSTVTNARHPLDYYQEFIVFNPDGSRLMYNHCVTVDVLDRGTNYLSFSYPMSGDDKSLARVHFTINNGGVGTWWVTDQNGGRTSDGGDITLNLAAFRAGHQSGEISCNDKWCTWSLTPTGTVSFRKK